MLALSNTIFRRRTGLKWFQRRAKLCPGEAVAWSTADSRRPEDNSPGAAAETKQEDVDSTAPLTGKVAIVTGGSRGIGRAIAERLGRDGASVVVNYVQNVDKAKEVVSAIESAGA